ncbi:MAG: hypothetical protein U0U67_11510 [Chitinophagales bacterium]
MYYKFFTLFFLSILLFSCKKETNNNARIAPPAVEVKTESWMHDLITLYASKNIALIDIMMPGAHDAGLYELNSCTFGANYCNTETQLLNFADQLKQGIRIFDVRPSFADNKFYTEHSTGCGGLGCKGAYLTTIYNDINTFLDTHAELVILEFSHFCGTSVTDTAFLNLTYRLLGDKIYKETTASSVSFIHQPLKDIIGNGTSGKVLMMYEGIANNATNRANGMFSGNYIPKEGAWTNSHYLKDMHQGQLTLYRNFSNDGNHLFQFSWQITQNELQSINCALNPNAPSIHKTADSANVTIAPVMDSLISIGQIRKGRIPNVIYLDYSESFVTKQCIKISRLNLE